MKQSIALIRAAFLIAVLGGASATLSWGQCSGTSTSQTCTSTFAAVSAAINAHATTYPVSQTVGTPTAMAGAVTHVDVTINGLNASDSFNGGEVLLVAPNGTQLVILAYPGDAFSAFSGNLQIIDTGTDQCGGLPLTSPALAKNCNTSGGAANHLLPGGNSGQPDGFSSVAAPGTSCTHLVCGVATPPSVKIDNTFNAVANANGTWSLYIINNQGLASYSFTGWSITVHTSGAAAVSTTTAVSPANTSVTRTPPNPSSPATITATVSSTSTVNGGTIVFSDNGTPVTCSGGNQTVANGSATCNLTFTQEGVHPITASYSGVSGFTPSSSSVNAPANVTVTNNTIVNGNSYCNVGNLAIPASGTSFGPSGPYPSQIFVGVNGSANLTGVITNLTIDLKQIQHQNSDSPSLLLVSPSGIAYILMANAYSSTAGGPVDITLSDAGATQLPSGAGLGFTAGTFRPADYNGSASQDEGIFPAPAPQSGFLFPAPLGNTQPAGSSTIGQAFNGAGATGTWQLFVLNNAGGSGALNNGWCLNFTVNANLHATTTVTAASPSQSYTTAPNTSEFPPVPANDFVTLTATTSSDVAVNVGSVTFTENGANVACAFGTSNPATVSGGVAQCKTTFTSEGNHIIRATFHDSGATFGDSHGNTLERTDSHSTRISTGSVNYQYCNPGQITIPGFAPSNVAAAPASPYPSNLFINDLPGTINKVTLSIPDFVIQSVAIRDVTSMLVGPNQIAGDSLDVFSHVGTNASVFTATYTLDDGATTSPTQATNPASGTYKPASFNAPTYPSLSPAGPYPPPSGTPQRAAPSGTSTFASVYGSGTANTRTGDGVWSLFQQSTVNGTTIFEGNGSNLSSWCLNFTVNPPDLTVTTTHPGTFKRGGTNTISVTVNNANGPGPSGGLITVIDTLPSGLSGSSFTNATAAGWTCSGTTTVTCTNPAAIAQAGSETFTFDVSVATSTADLITNNVSISGGGDGNLTNNTANDGPNPVIGTVLTITKTHTDPFTQGQNGATYSLTVTNTGASGAGSGPGVTRGTVTITDTIPSAYVVTGFSGTGWTCESLPALMCTLNAALPVGSTSNAITLTANVPATMEGPVTNTANLSAVADQIGTTADNTHSDPTNITQVPTSVSATAGGGQSANINTAFATALSATVEDAATNPVAGVHVTFTPPSTGASGTFAVVTNGTQTCTASSCVVTTNASGVATASTFTANGTAGAYNVVATAASLTPVNFGLTNTDPPAAVTNVSSTTANGSYNTGNTVAITVAFTKTVNVTGTPQLALNSGGTASYASGSGTNTLTFNYLVAAGQNSAHLDATSTTALSLNGGTISNVSGVSAVLTLPAPGAAGSLGANKSIVIDTAAPTVSSVSSTTANGTYGIGKTVAITVTFSEPVTASGTPQLALNSGGTASYASGSGTATLTFNYVVAAGQNTAHLEYTSTSALSLNGGTIKDTAGNSAALTLLTPGAPGSLSANTSIAINTTAPTLPTVVSYSVLFGTDTYNVIGSSRTRLPWQITGIKVVFSEAITAADMNSLTGVTTTGFSGLGTNTLTWTITPVALGNLATVLAGSGPDVIADSNGNGLGAGAGFSQNLKILWGDFNDDGVVNSQDLALVNTARSQTYNIFADLNGDGIVDVNDVQVARTRAGTTLP